VPGRLPDPSPRATERLRRLQTEVLPRTVREPAVEDANEDLRPEQTAEPVTPSSAEAERGTPSTSQASQAARPVPSPADDPEAPVG
jgi:hypothetical protein